MSSSPTISLPQIPKNLDKEMMDYLTALTKVLTAKQIDDYNSSKSPYQIGSIYITTYSDNPAVYYGGEWEAFGTGRTLIGIDTTQTEFNTSEKTGGEKTHTLTIPEMPSHNHITYARHSFYEPEDQFAKTNEQGYQLEHIPSTYTGGDQPHNNLQPYITVYMWKRIK